MNSDTARRYGPWVIVGALLLLGGGTIGPAILFSIQTIQQIVIAALGVGLTVALIPTAVVLLRNLIWKARKEVIAAMPIETLELGLQKIDERIADIGKRLGEGKAAYTRMEQQIEQAKNILKPERLEFQRKKLQGFAGLLDRQDRARQLAKATRAEVSQKVEEAKLELALGKGFASAASALSAGQPGGGTDDMNVAFESINKTLTEAQVALEIALEDHEDNDVQHVQANEVQPKALEAPQTPMDGMTVERPGVFIRNKKQ